MAVTLRASARIGAVPSVSVISAENGGKLVLTASGLDPDPNITFLAVGPVTDGPPATYADFTDDVGSRIMEAQCNIASTYDVAGNTRQVSMSFPVPSAYFTLGAELWVAVFSPSDAPPGPTVAPDAVAGPFAVVA